MKARIAPTLPTALCYRVGEDVKAILHAQEIAVKEFCRKSSALTSARFWAAGARALPNRKACLKSRFY